MAEKNGKDKRDARTERVMRVMFRPGTEVRGASGWRATVYPMGIRHVQRALHLLSSSPRLAIALSKVKRGMTTEEMAGVALEAMPMLAGDGLDLVAECTHFDEPAEATVEDIPHWELPGIIEAWVEANFKDERSWLPWVEALDRILPGAGKLTESTSATPSPSSTSRATASTTS